MSTDLDPHDDDDEGGIGLPAQLRDPMGVVRRQAVFAAIILGLTLVLVAATTAILPLQYKARATILLTAKSIPDEFVPTTVLANIMEEFEAVRGEVFSRARLSEIILETGLYAKNRETDSLPSVVDRLRNELAVRQTSYVSRSRSTPHSVVFEVTLTGADPEKVANVVNVTVRELINQNIEYRSAQARLATQFMKREFDRADEVLRQHQRKLEQFRSDNRGALPENQEATLSKLERLEEERRSTIFRISDLRARLNRISDRPQVVGENESLDSLRRRLQHARSIYTEEHPSVRSLERQIEAYTTEESTEGSSMNVAASEEKSSLKEAIAIEETRLQQIDEDVQGLEENLVLAPKIAEDYAAMLREEQILRENYVEYLRKLKDAELALSLESAQQGAQLTRLDAAIPPTSPVVPRWMIAAMGIAASLGLTVVLAILRELLNSVVIDEQHLEDVIPIPCVGSIAEIG